jgi:hypothetical protein
MVEYGNGVGHATGAGGGGGGGGATTDIGAGAERFVNDAVNTISGLPPTTLVLIVVLIFLGLLILRRAF